MKVIETEPLPIKVWGSAIDESAVAQARNLANLPFAFDHIALLPDAHVGFGMPIGGVFAAEGQVVPHAVGLDIGCGVRAWPLGVTVEDLLPVRDSLLHDIRRSVPLGFDWHHESQEDRTDLFVIVPDARPLAAEVEKAKRQLGTLGGGNHFIELQVDASGAVWAMVHTGSRNVGKQMAEYYDRVAREEAGRLGGVPAEWGLAHLDVSSDAGSEYLVVMRWCLDFATENRRLIAEAVRDAVARRFPLAVPGEAIDVHHNYAEVEPHFGRSVVVHRKGAVCAEGSVLVPGSMGSASFVARGLESPESFRSCAHGAGRAMGRKAARRSIRPEDVVADLRRKDVTIEAARRRDIPEEAPQAYKDIDSVMSEQSDLVLPLLRLRPLGVIKG